MDSLLGNLECVCCYLDDILVCGRTVEEHASNLKEVLTRLQKAGVRLSKDKCTFEQSSVTYLGHVIDKNGLRPTTEKVETIKSAAKPKSLNELRTFLGLVNFYRKFVPNMLQITEPLNKLTKKGVTFQWSKAQQQAFQLIKEHISSQSVLQHFTEGKPIVLSCDASPTRNRCSFITF